MKSILLNFLLCVFLLWQSCINDPAGNEEHVAVEYESDIQFKRSNTLSIDHQDSLIKFKSFAKKFPGKKLPFELKIGSKGWINFNSDDTKEISREEAGIFFCENNKKCLEQPTGGFYQYYYGWKVVFPNVTGLIFYRTSNDYPGYFLSTFDSANKLKSTIFLSGAKGEFDTEAQKEAVITEDGKIYIREIDLLGQVSSSGNLLNATLIIETFEINSDGNIVLLSRSDKQHKKVRSDQKQRDRLILVDAKQ